MGTDFDTKKPASFFDYLPGASVVDWKNPFLWVDISQLDIFSEPAGNYFWYEDDFILAAALGADQGEQLGSG
jgi:hypothetical protein